MLREVGGYTEHDESLFFLAPCTLFCKSWNCGLPLHRRGRPRIRVPPAFRLLKRGALSHDTAPRAEMFSGKEDYK